MNLNKVTFWLLVIGGLNWGLVLFGLGVGQYLGLTLARVLYALVALSAIYQVMGQKKMQM